MGCLVWGCGVEGANGQLLRGTRIAWRALSPADDCVRSSISCGALQAESVRQNLEKQMNQDQIDEAAIASFVDDLPGGMLAIAVEVFAGIGFIASCIWLFAII
jgi:hypothetical protein